MADYGGFQIAGFQGLITSPNVSSAITGGRGYAQFLPDIGELPPVLSGGVFAAGAAYVPLALVGVFEQGHTEQYYNTIVFDPAVLNVGIITSDVILGFNFFNGLIHEASATVTDFTVTGGTATLIGRNVSDSFLRLENYGYSVQIPGVGDDEIALVLTWTFDTGHVASYTVTGLRTTISVDVPEFPSIETLQFKSLVTPTYTGEFRGGFRRHPRHIVSYNYFLSGDELSRFYSNIYSGNTSNYTFPLWRQAFPIGALAAGATVLPYGLLDHDFKVNDSVFIYDPLSGSELLTITAVAISSVTVAATGINHSSQAYLTPTITGFMRVAPEIKLRSRDNAFVKMIIESSTYYSWSLEHVNVLNTLYGMEIFNSIPVWKLPNYEQQGVDYTAFTDKAILDNESGVPKLIIKALVTREFSTLNVVLRTYTEITLFKRMMYFLNGKTEPMYLPSNRPELVPTQATITNGASALDVSGATGLDAFGNTTRAIQIQYADGTVFNTLATIIGSGTSITMSPVIDREITSVADQITLICFLNKVRLNTDEVVINHVDHGKSVSSIPLVNSI